MYITELNLSNLLAAADLNSRFNSDEWYLYIKSRLSKYIAMTQSRRELFPWFEDADDPDTAAEEAVDTILELNAYTYRHMWKLYTAEYNPIWNVEGTEKTVRERDNTGTQENKLSGKDTLTYSGSEANAKTGTDTNVQSGSIKDQHGGAMTKSRTTYDSASFLDVEKDSDTLENTTTYNSKQDQITYLSTDTKSFTGRNDETSYGKTDTRTDNLKEKETITHTRGGNIGVTKTTEMEADEVAWLKKFNFLERITCDICNVISYHLF